MVVTVYRHKVESPAARLRNMPQQFPCSHGQFFLLGTIDGGVRGFHIVRSARLYFWLDSRAPSLASDVSAVTRSLVGFQTDK